MKSYSVALAIAGFASSVAAHGYVSSPAPRMPGDGLKAACGDQVYNTQNSDHYGNVQGALQNLQGSHPDCRMWQCKGIPFSDHGEIQQYTPGQVVNMKVEIRAPHNGRANVSIINLATDKVVGKPLISWDEYAMTSVPISQHPEWTEFNFTMPDVRTECPGEGKCAIQWFWDAPSIDQTYESCIDFVMAGGSGSGSGSGSGNGTSTPAPSPSAGDSTVAPSPSPSAAAAEGASPATSPSPSPAQGGASGSDSSIPQTFTIDTFIAWLRKTAGTGAADKLRRMVAAGGVHPRAFRG